MTDTNASLDPPQYCDEDTEHQYWITPNTDKLGKGTRQRLEAWIQDHHDLSGFILRRCDLSGINLARTAEHPEAFQFCNADLYRADFSNAHLYSVDFSSAVLMKANFDGANLHGANMENANLLGISLNKTRLDNVHWGERVLQEKQAIAAEKKGDEALAKELYQEAEETYRNLRINLEKAGLPENAGHFFHREMVMRRRQLPLLSVARGLSLLVDLFSGYGEKPLRVVFFSMSFILLCACIYFFSAGILYQGVELGFNSQTSVGENFSQFISCLYFSVVTFTTLGYGDITPLGSTRALAAIEAFGGSFTMALFVVVFVKKMTR
ncbi:pentapeptide repeat-containing protein [Oceanicoccus sp. KOV_DT_Chl]|uniref:pentapeptide repeat-containing protein n=1 Tax=Oceanicoccus sp. KOV_DT_Chl TaxID=1904639 RepID=UPI0013596362|nr:pentapeptide repeat-containing protein [Oceanicoccus sp. KOV_DT_Chl]